jgi:hypothetical protein
VAEVSPAAAGMPWPRRGEASVSVPSPQRFGPSS